MRDNDIRHIDNSHGVRTNEKYPITEAGLKQIPDIVENYDDVYYVEHDDGRTGIYYKKKVDNGIIYYLEGELKGSLLENKQMIKVPSNGELDIKVLKETKANKKNKNRNR